MAEETKQCGTCRYGYLGPGYEPCKSCGNDCSKWESDSDGIIPMPVDMRFATVDETKEPEKYIYYIIYRIVSTGSIAYDIVELSSKINRKGILDIIILLATKRNIDRAEITILNWKELEG